MRDFSIDIIWAKIQAAITALGGWLGLFLGGVDGLLYALIIFAAIDYITGVMVAIANKKLSSTIGFKGIAKKTLLFALVGVAHTLDKHVVGGGAPCARLRFSMSFQTKALASWKTQPAWGFRFRRS